jgi:ribosome biogenesis protein MAK21
MRSAPLQESALANLPSLDMLLGWVTKRKGGRTVVQQAIEALQEAFVNFLLPDRKLRSFDQQPLQVRAIACL